jgi:hypothetical protein
MYDITDYSYQQAKKLGVEIKPSTRKGKKLDVFKQGKKVASVGALGYNDYPHLLQSDKDIAKQKRKAYKARHQNDRTKVGTAGFYADKLLW